jgi:hypothetical protein
MALFLGLAALAGLVETGHRHLAEETLNSLMRQDGPLVILVGLAALPFTQRDLLFLLTMEP